MIVTTRCALDLETTGERKVDTADSRRATFSLAAVANDEVGCVTFTPPRIEGCPNIIVHNMPYDAVVLGHADAEWDDTKMLALMAGEEDTTLKGLVVRHLKRPVVNFQQATEAGETDRYCLADARNTWEVEPILRGMLPPETARLYDEVEKPLLPLWAEMTLRGSYYLDRGALADYEAMLTDEVAGLLARIQDGLPRGRTVVKCTKCGRRKEQVGKGERCKDGKAHGWKGGSLFDPDEPVNIDSPVAQLLPALQKMGLPVSATDVESLRRVGDHPVVGALLEYRSKVKVLGTYVRPWLTTPEGERMGCVWRPTGVGNGGRVSSAYPNLQNVPHHLERFWLPAEGHTFLTMDNSQLEIRIAAHLSGDPVMRQACYGDLHGELQAAYGLDNRRRAKVWTFGNLYLGGPGVLMSEATKAGDPMTWPEAEYAHAQVRKKLPHYFEWAQAQVGKRRVAGLFGRWHTIHEEDGGKAGRKAVNDPIQAGAGTVTKMQMLALRRAGFTIISQVHDSVTVEVGEEEREVRAREMKGIMEGVAEGMLDVPLVVEEK